MFNKHQYLSCKVKTIFSIYHSKKMIHKFDNGVYGGKILWHMNPEAGVTVPANFLKIPANKKLPKRIDELQVQVEVTIIDKFGWEHELLPVSWIYTPSAGWYYEPFKVKSGI